MRFSDPYTDDSRAVALAADLKLESDGRQVARRAAAGNAAAGAGARRSSARTWSRSRRAGSSSSTTSTRRPRRARRSRRGRGSSTTSSRSGRSRRWATRFTGVLAAHRGQPVAGVVLATDGRSNTGEDPLRAAEAAVRQNIPIYAIAAGADEGPRNIRLAEIEVSPVVFVRDPMTLGVVVEARGLQGRRGDGRAGTARSTTAAGSRSAASGSSWARTASSSGRRSGITPKVVGQYEYRARVEDAGPELTQDDNVATAAVRVVRQQIRVLLIAGAAVARGPVPPQRARCATSTSSSPPGSSTPTPAFASRATGRSRGCPTTPPSCAGTTRSCWSTPTCAPWARSGPR